MTDTTEKPNAVTFGASPATQALQSICKLDDLIANKFYPCCPACGSASLTCDATARWDFLTQAWAMSDLLDYVACDDCGAEEFEPINKPHP